MQTSLFLFARQTHPKREECTLGTMRAVQPGLDFEPDVSRSFHSMVALCADIQARSEIPNQGQLKALRRSVLNRGIFWLEITPEIAIRLGFSPDCDSEESSCAAL